MSKEKSIDSYIQLIENNDIASDQMSAIVAPTLRNVPQGLDGIEYNIVDIISEGMNGTVALRIPEGYQVAAFAMGADQNIKTDTPNGLADYSASLVDRLVERANQFDFIPVGFGDVVDTAKCREESTEIIGNSLLERANHYSLPVLNGETAELGKLVEDAANIMGVMIALVPETSKYYEKGVDKIINGENNAPIAIFDPNGKPVTINFDGIGTKTDPYMRANKPEKGVIDWAAMNADDTAKSAAEVRALLGLLETNDVVTPSVVNRIKDYASKVGEKINALCALSHENLGARINAYKPGAMAYNISGAAVNTIDESLLNNPPMPKEGDFLIAIKGDGPRSNGITAKRDSLERTYGQDWHETEEGKEFLEYMTTPSALFYPMFKDLLDSGNASSVYHMSGGAYKGKLARPIAKAGLHVRIGKQGDTIEDLFEVPSQDEFFTREQGMNMETAYEKSPRGNEGFVSTSNPQEAMRIMKEYGYETRIVGRFEENVEGKTGVTLANIYDSTGSEVYFSGQKK